MQFFKKLIRTCIPVNSDSLKKARAKTIGLVIAIFLAVAILAAISYIFSFGDIMMGMVRIVAGPLVAIVILQQLNREEKERK